MPTQKENDIKLQKLQMPQKDNAIQRAKPLKTIGAPKLDLEPESSAAAGPCEVSGEELAGEVPGDLLEGSVAAGESAGVAELEGMPAEEASGGDETDGASTGLLTGDTTAVGGELAGDETGGVEDTLLEGLIAGETEDGGWTAGDFAGGAVAGGGVDADPDGETAGVCEGGDKVGDFAGDAGEFVGETETEDGGFAVTDDLGEEAGAFCANKTVNNIESTKSENNLFIFEVFEDLENTRMNETMG